MTLTVMAAAVLAVGAAQGQALADEGTHVQAQARTQARTQEQAQAPALVPADTTPAPAQWQPSGTPLAGADNTADAPQMTAGTTYRDTILPNQTKYYGIALDATSSAYASAFAVPGVGTRVKYNDGIELKLQSASGSDCDSQDADFGDDDPRPIGTAVSRTVKTDSSTCQDANQYTLQVTRTSDATSTPDPWPLELRCVLEPPLAQGTATQPAPDYPSSSPTPLTTGTPRPAHGGSSPRTAASVKTGIWKDQVLPGETRFYRVPVDWGQQATAFADFAGSPTRAGSSSYVSSGVRLRVFSPVLEYVTGDNRGYDGSQVSLDAQLPPVAYANRAAVDDDVAATRFAGWYYLAVTVHPQVSRTVKGAVPIVLRIEVQGTAQPGPAYTGDPGRAGIGVTASDVSSANGSSGHVGSSSDSSGLRFLAFAALGAGTVLLLSLAVWVLTARRRSPRSADAAPTQTGYGPPRW